MISNLLSFFISSLLQRKPVYEELALQDGIDLPAARSRSAAGQARALDLLLTTQGCSRANIYKSQGKIL